MKTYTVELVKRETKDDFVVKMVNEFGNRSVYPRKVADLEPKPDLLFQSVFQTQGKLKPNL